jgi:hypothetical protein
MARARNIKPGLFKNEVLGVADPLYTILFEGLWVLADRDGKLEDRPVRIKGEVFAYREGLDVEAMLEWLDANEFILRYVVGGKRYILIREFKKHQNPHKNEAPSEIPNPEEIGTSTEKIGSETETAGTTRADSLSSDSGFLIPDSLQETTSLSSPDGDSPPKVVRLPERQIPCPYERLLEAFHDECPTLPRVMKLNDARKTHLAKRWREVDADSKFESVDDGVAIFRGIFKRVHASDFLSGRSKDWKATFDWITESSTKFLKVCEGHYDNDQRKAAR